VLKEMVPKVSRVALLRNPDNPATAAQLQQAEAAARASGVRLQPLEARVPQEIDRAFAAMTRERAGALVILADSVFTNQLTQIAELAAKGRLPAIYVGTEYPEAGGLMGYGASLLDLERRAATYVDRILKGAKPGDLPVEQPTKFDLVINLKTAKAIGLTIPPSLLQRANQIID
jgi:putative tryptophan/tyrosine transport system substrate-binding protein